MLIFFFFSAECTQDNDCPFDKSCVNNFCSNPCLLGHLRCGRNAECLVVDHHPQCSCPQGTQGDPKIICIISVCHYNEDCPDDQACDRLNRICRLVCDSESCAETAYCRAINHQPKCYCPPGTTGIPDVDCSPISTQVECTSDDDCPHPFGCMNNLCKDPCSLSDMCAQDQDCRVLDTHPLRTMICECPSDTYTDSNGRCQKIALNVQCHSDDECDDSSKCSNGNCIEACLVSRCGINAQCRSSSHTGLCYCGPGYIGNAYIECSPEPRIPIVPNQPECYANDECSEDRQCVNSKCVNPCVSSEVCGINALCHVDNHNPVCRCPVGHLGDPKFECIPPSVALGCSSNSKCLGTEACINSKCINPCNCGVNSDCIITNHYPSCICQPGYSGNPQLGCYKLECESDEQCSYDQTCYQNSCINPCVIENPCAINAECFGKNHRSACKCSTGFFGNAEVQCERAECFSDYDCPQNLACDNKRCIDPCSINSPCAANANCYVRSHQAFCICPENLPIGNPFSYCQRRPIVEEEPECKRDMDCPSKLACIKEICVNPCLEIRPCSENAVCGVLDTIPVRTMVCTCPQGWKTDSDGVCRPIEVAGACSADSECPETEACVNRRCRDPCSCGKNANCFVRNHRPICSCLEGYQGNPEIACFSVECRRDSECMPDKSCINNSCVNPCLIENPCGTNAECFVDNHRSECRCREGFLGDAKNICHVIGCYSNSDCPGDRSCINKQCIDPCIYENKCAKSAECRIRSHIPICRCPPGFIGNPDVDCHIEDEPECRADSDCPSVFACLNQKCQNPCSIIEPCSLPSECRVLPTYPVRTMACTCPSGYISSGSGTCEPVAPIVAIGCRNNDDCEDNKSCINGVCRNPCACGENANCDIINHKPVCSCLPGFDGNPDIECFAIKQCRSNSECLDTHVCVQNTCVPACSPILALCAPEALCYGINHQAVCECPAGFAGNPRVSCDILGCRTNSDCPTNRACTNRKCENPCTVNPCDHETQCSVDNHVVECSCPPGFMGDVKTGCSRVHEKCKHDHECPSQTACFDGECINPCTKIEPCGVNAECTVLDTTPVRTMICECLPGYRGNAVIRCEKENICNVEKGQIRDQFGHCVCPPGFGKNEQDLCVPCSSEKGMIITQDGSCICDLEKNFFIDEYGRCVCPIEHGYEIDRNNYCRPNIVIECVHNDECPDDKYCEQSTGRCQDPCLTKTCAPNAICNVTGHVAVCNFKPPEARTDFPKPEMEASCLSDGVQVMIHVQNQGFDGVLYVRGRSKEEQCRRLLSIPADNTGRTETFKVNFGSCGLIHVNGEASFVLVIQKHPKLVTYKAQAYHVKCLYQTGEQNVTLGFNVSMLTTAGTIANTGPPPTCLMRIVTQTGNEIQSAEIGDNLMLQVEVQPNSIYGGFARNCVAKTMEDNQENEYIVTDENGCATDPTIFGEWEHEQDSQSLMASFNAFKFPSSDNIRFQCNIRVCFGKCQPVSISKLFFIQY